MDKDLRKWKIRPPKGLADYIRTYCQENTYIIFNEKIHTAVCTACDKEFDYEKLGMSLEHTGYYDKPHDATCPACGRRSITKNARYGRKQLKDEGRIIWFRKRGAVTFMEMDDYIIDYTTPHPGIWVAPSQQIRICKKSQERMDFIHGYWTPDAWVQVDKIGVKAPRRQIYGLREQHTHVMWSSLQYDLGDDLKYADPSKVRFWSPEFDEYDAANAVISYLSDFLKYPAIELLEKAGFESIVQDRAHGRRTKHINIRAKSLRKILRMNGAEVRYLQGVNPTIGDIENIYMVRRYWPQAKIEDIRELAEVFPRFIVERIVKRIAKFARIDKVMKMLLENNRATGRTMTLTDYSDYLEWVIRMGLRKDKRTIYPKDFQAAHDELLAKVHEEEDRTVMERFRRSQKLITGMVGPFSADGILIRPADSPDELRRESSELHHCVRTYVNKVAEGRTSILFIRKEEAPGKPWYTLELDMDGRIVQCRGDHNCEYPPEVAEFIKKWMKWRRKQLEAA